MADEILVLRLSSLGDVVLTSSFLQSAAEHFPGARIGFVVREDLAEVVAALPHVSQVVAVRRGLGPAALVDLARELARGPWTHVFDLHGSLRSLALASGLRRRLRPGFRKQAVPRWLLVHAKRDTYARFGGAQPLRVRMLEPLGRMGFAPQLHDTRLVLPLAARQRAGAALAGAGIRDGETLLGIAPGARWPSKCWPPERFASLVARLTAIPGRRVVLVGGRDDRAAAGIAALGHPAASADLCDRLDLLASAAALERCAVAITNDTGLLHVAEAVGRPVVAIFGPTAPQFGYAPYRPGSRLLRQPPRCNPCSKNGSRPCLRPTHECMENVSVEMVHEAVEAVLSGVMSSGPPVARAE